MGLIIPRDTPPAKERAEKKAAADSPRRRFLARWFPPVGEPGKASQFIRHLAELAKARPGLEVVLHCRVSSCDQDLSGSLDRQREWALEQMAKLGVVVVGDFWEVASGWFDPHRWRIDRHRLAAAAAKARELGAVLVAVSTDRFVRKFNYRPDRIDEGWPNVDDFEKLKDLTEGVTLATIVHPDTPLREVRGIEAKRGMKATGHKGGRPRAKKPGHKKRRRLELKPRARRMRKRGLSLGQIATELGVPKATVQTWTEGVAAV